MIPVSSAFKEALANGNSNWLAHVDITFPDDTTLAVDRSLIWEGGFAYNQAVSGQSDFQIGTTVIDEFTLKLCNIYGDFDQYMDNFVGAKVVATVGLYSSDGSAIESFKKGVYFVDEVSSNGSIVQLDCLDEMALLDSDYSNSTLTYPATLAAIVQDICTVCGVELETSTFTRSTYEVKEKPSSESLTCRDVLGMVCEIACLNAHINRLGKLELKFYDTKFLKKETDDADFSMSSFYSYEADTQDVQITGVKVGETLEGTDTYCIEIDNNELINEGDEATIAKALGDELIGMSFRPFNITHPPDPSMEPGDTVLLTDAKGNSIRSMITDTSFSVGQKHSTKCTAESYSVARSVRYSEASKVAERVSGSVAVKEVNKYDELVQNYADLIANGFGMFRTEIEDPYNAGSYVYAMHNKASYSDSTFAIVLNDQGLFVGNRDNVASSWTWAAGLASDGSALVETLTANQAIIEKILANDITVTGQLHSDDFVAGTIYSQAGIGIDFDAKTIQAENFAINSAGDLKVKSGTIGEFTITSSGLEYNAVHSFDPDALEAGDYGVYIGGEGMLVASVVTDTSSNQFLSWVRLGYGAIHGEVPRFYVDQSHICKWKLGGYANYPMGTDAAGLSYIYYDTDDEGKQTGDPITMSSYNADGAYIAGSVSIIGDGTIPLIINSGAQEKAISITSSHGWPKISIKSTADSNTVALANFYTNSSGTVILESRPDGTASNRCYLSINKKDTALSNRLKLYDVTNGTSKTYQIYHAGNKPPISTSQLWSGSWWSTTEGNFGSSSWGYSGYVLVGLTSGNSYITMYIPANHILTTNRTFCIADDAGYMKFYLRYTDKTLYVTGVTRTSGYTLRFLYGIK